MSEFNVIKMYSKSHLTDMWFVVRNAEVKNKQDYYGPWFDKGIAVKFMHDELLDKLDK